MTPVIIGTLLALVALGYVLAPLFRDVVELVPIESGNDDVSDASAEIDALKEIEFDHATGKLSESDYLQLKTRYTDRAIVRMKEIESTSGDGSAVLCSVCGSRGQAGDLFCSECGNPFKLPVGNN